MSTGHHEKHHPTKQEIEQGKAMAILAYIIAIIPYFAEKKNKFVRFHAIQGMNILIISIAWFVIQSIVIGVISAIFSVPCAIGGFGCIGNNAFVILLSGAFNLVSLFILALDVVGLIYAASGQMQEVPIIGKFKIIRK